MALKVHVTGGKGFLGRYIAEALGGHEVDVSDVDTLDVTDREAVAARLRASPPAVVVHLAGLTGAEASLRDPAGFFAVNFGGTVNVLEACRLVKVPGLVFLSSLTVHGQTDSGSVEEGSPFAPRHPYGGSKAAAEVAVQTWARCYAMRAACLRPTLIAGEGQKEANAISEFAALAARGDAIELFGDGSHQREWLHPQDVGAAVRAAVDWAARGAQPACEAFLISSGAPISMAALAKKVIAMVGRGRLELKPSTRQAFNLCTATDKAARLLGWRPAVGIDEIVRRVIAATHGQSARA